MIIKDHQTSGSGSSAVNEIDELSTGSLEVPGCMGSSSVQASTCWVDINCFSLWVQGGYGDYNGVISRRLVLHSYSDQKEKMKLKLQCLIFTTIICNLVIEIKINCKLKFIKTLFFMGILIVINVYLYCIQYYILVIEIILKSYIIYFLMKSSHGEKKYCIL